MKNVLFIGDSESCDLGLGESLIRHLQVLFPKNSPFLKVMAFSNAQPQDFTIGNRVAHWGNYMKYSDGSLPLYTEGLITDHGIYPHVDSLMRMKGALADFVFIQLGTNCLPVSSTNRMEQFKDLCAAILKVNPKAQITWITPPNNHLYSIAQSDKLDAELSQTVGFKNLLVTRTIVGMRPGDGEGWPDRDKEHFKICPQAWLEAAAAKITSVLASSSEA